MREFVVLGHTATTEPDFPLDDIAGGAGRLDVLCRCVNAAFFLSHGLREDVRAYLVLQDTVTIRFDGASLRNLNPDERSTAARVRSALEDKREAVGARPYESSPGVSVLSRGLEAVLAEHVEGTTVIQLHEAGEPIAGHDPPETPVFVLSDHREFTDADEAVLDAHADARLRVGPRALHADHAITVVHNYLDTAGYTSY